MATPNYGYEKRQRELAKKQKKEEKERAKAERRRNPGDPDVAEPGEPESDGNPPGTAPDA